MSSAVASSVVLDKSTKHRRRSSLSEALHGDNTQEPPSDAAQDSSALEQSGPTAEAVTGKRQDDDAQEQGSVREYSPKHSSAIAIHPFADNVEVAGRQVEESPFTPEDTPSYILCPDPPRQSTSSSNTLGTVPEDSISPPDETLTAPTSSVGSDIVGPSALNLPKVKTPRKGLPEQSDSDTQAGKDQQSLEEGLAAKGRRASAGSSEERFSIDFTRQTSEALDNTFNPFADRPEDTAAAQEVTSPVEDAFFAMDFDNLSQQPSAELPFVAHLDFGERHGSGVVGPKINASDYGRTMDKFEVKEGEDADIKQLLWVIENLQEELSSSGKALERATASIKERQAIVDALQEEHSSAEAEEAELEEELRVLHSKLEAQLLTKLEQEDDIRVSGDKLKSVKAEIVTLDASLAKAEEQRKVLERRALEKRASLRREVPQVGSADAAQPVIEPSPGSNYSSAWETSDSENEDIDLQALNAPRPSAGLFEENQAKLKEKGGLGGSWLRHVLSGRSKSDFESTLADGKTSTSEALGAGQSHFQQPTIAAELAIESSESTDEPDAPSSSSR